MVINSKAKLEVNKIYNQDNYPIQPAIFTVKTEKFSKWTLMVLREANERDYLDYLSKDHPGYMPTEFFEYYYEVSMD